MDAELEAYDLAWNCGYTKPALADRQREVDAHNAEMARRYTERSALATRALAGDRAATEQLLAMPPVTPDDIWPLFTEEQKAERNRVCQDLATVYVLAHPELRSYSGLNIPELVGLVSAARAAGDEERRIRLDIWLNAAFEYQKIGGMFGGEPRDLPPINVAGDSRPAAGG